MSMTEVSMTPDRKRAFTLTELLIVIGLLVLMLVLALPAVNFITGARSTESATNVIGALLGSARSQAIAQQSNVGVLFFWDRTKEQTVGGLCATAQIWDPTASYVDGDVVQFGVDASGNPAYYICLTPLAGGTNPSSNTSFWKNCASYKPNMPLLLDGFELQTLPKGVGLQGVVIGNQSLDSTLGVGAYDRYVSTACIMFDGEGRLTFTQYGIYAGENVGTTGGTVVFSRLQPLLNSQRNIANMGLTEAAIALYDRAIFHDQGNTSDPVPENDYIAGDYNTPTHTSPNPNQFATDAPNEPNEEFWIDNNSTFLLVNRYNGTLLKSE
jgi:type II secretory pathway pseudopilin PulG